MARRIALCLLLVTLSLPALAQIDARMLRTPDVSATSIAFTYAGDIWIVPKEGGAAQRLSTPRGQEIFPRFSPDGREIAFTANYDGNLDVYVMPATGGVPRRITHHPETDRVLGWAPDGAALLIASDMSSEKDRFSKIFKVSKTGGLPEQLPVPYGEFGTLSSDGKLLAYMPISTEFRTWKRYRGGMASQIWIFDLATKASYRLPQQAGSNDGQPMWHGRTLYFLSDRDANKRANIWSYDTGTKQFKQLTFFKEYDVRFPSAGPHDIVFENADTLYLLDLATAGVKPVPVTVLTDLATLKPRAANVSKLVTGVGVSPAGKRAVVEARGEVFSVPAEHGPVINLTRSSGVAERFPAWSPDGKTIAYFSDRSGEYELTVRAADGSGEERTVTKLGPGFRYHIYWSPDGKKVAFVDQAMRISVVDVADGKVTPVDKGLFMFEGELQGFRPSWSPDSRWLAYTRDAANRSAPVFLFDTKTAKLTQATSSFYAYAGPVFDPEGKYLYVLVNRTFKPVYSDLDNTWVYPNTTGVAAIALRRDVASPLAPRNDVEEKKDEGKKDEGKAEAKAKSKDDAKDKDAKDKDKDKDKAKDEAKDKEAPKPVEIDLEGLEARVVVLPVPSGNYGELGAVKGKVLYRRTPRSGSADEKSPLLAWDLAEREEKTVLGDVDGFEVAAGGEKLLVRIKENFAIVDAKPDQKADKTLKLGDLETVVDPRAEWKQIFNDVWRLERDYFYDPGMHGVDWKAMRARYGKLIDDAVTRWDVNFVLGELISELNASHTYRGGGDTEQPVERGAGLLGVDWSLENGAYRFKKIIETAPWDTEVRSPLREPGIDVKEGEYLLAVNRVPVDTTQDPWAAFGGLAGKDVLLTVNSKPALDGAREVLVTALGDEGRLRNLAWIESNRRKVDAASGGRIGYVYVPDTGINGQNELVRQYRAQYDKDGLVVDERFNSGGQIPDRFVELLNRPVRNYWAVRDGADWVWPYVGHTGPKAMLINGWSGSGGDAFPFYFKQAGLGPLIGTRTWGGLIGISGCPGLVDGGSVTVPTFGIYSKDGQWIIESHGVDPDIEVVDDPALMQNGADPQLDRAIEEVKAALAKNPPQKPARPAYPNRAGY